MDVPDQPDQTFCSGVFLRLQLVKNEILDGSRLGRGCVLSVSYFLRSVSSIGRIGSGCDCKYLDITQHVALDGVESHRSKDIF